MAYDEELVDRLRGLLSDRRSITEKKMFGGHAFLLEGNLLVSASRTGGLLARIDPTTTDAALAPPHVGLMETGGRSMRGWIIVAPEGVRTQRQLEAWVAQSTTYVSTLPKKTTKKKMPKEKMPTKKMPTGK